MAQRKSNSLDFTEKTVKQKNEKNKSFSTFTKIIEKETEVDAFQRFLFLWQLINASMKEQ